MRLDEERISHIEFVNIYPSGADNHVFIMTAVTSGSHRILIYAPMISLYDTTMDSSYEPEEVYDWRHRPIMSLRGKRTVRFGTTIYSIKSTNNCEEFFKVICLDGPAEKAVKKEDIEKLFGCKIDG